MEEKIKETIVEETTKAETQEVETKQADFDINQILEHPQFKQVMESYADKRVGDAVKKTEAKYKKQLEEETKKLNMSAEEILAEKERELAKRELKLNTVDYFKGKGYSLDLMDFVNGESIEDIQEKSDNLMTAINSMVEKMVDERLKSSYKPTNNNNNKQAISINDLDGLSIEEINKQWNNLK